MSSTPTRVGHLYVLTGTEAHALLVRAREAQRKIDRLEAEAETLRTTMTGYLELARRSPGYIGPAVVSYGYHLATPGTAAAKLLTAAKVQLGYSSLAAAQGRTEHAHDAMREADRLLADALVSPGYLGREDCGHTRESVVADGVEYRKPCGVCDV